MGTRAELAERDLRFRKVREAMEQDGLDVLVVAGKGHWWTGRGYFRYLTDFHLWGHDGLILFPLEGEPVLTLTSAAVARMIGERGWITDVHGDPDIAVKIVEAAKARGIAKGKIGIVGQRFIMAVGTYEILNNGLPNARLVNADHVLDRVRAVKSPLEIQQNRELWALAKAAMERFVRLLEPGKTQLELSAEAVKVLASGGARDYLIFFNNRPPKDAPVALDDILSYHMETCGPSGHWCELTVTCAFRDPTSLELKLMDTELRAYEEIRKMARPGVRISEISKTFDRVMLEEGWQTSDKQIPLYDVHSQGMDVIEWPVHGSLDTRNAEVVLEEGMVFSYHPSRQVLPEAGFTGINEDMLITANGGERLSGDWSLRWRVMK